MQQFLLFFLSFLNFWFFPFIVLFVLSFVVEQVIRRTQSSELSITRAMVIRKFLFRQNLILNLMWFAALFLLMIVQKGASPNVNTEMVWQGY